MYVIIAGAGLVGRNIARVLVSHRHDVVVIDSRFEVCRSVRVETGAQAIHGSATDLRILEEAGARKAEVLVGVMPEDADNIACALLGRSLGISRVVARLQDPKYAQAYAAAGISSTVNTADLLIDLLVTEVEQPKVRKVWMTAGGKAGLYAVRIPPGARSIGRTVREIAGDRRFPQDCVLVFAYRPDRDEYLIPRGDYVIREEDTIFLVTGRTSLKAAADTLSRN